MEKGNQGGVYCSHPGERRWGLEMLGTHLEMLGAWCLVGREGLGGRRDVPQLFPVTFTSTGQRQCSWMCP